MRSLEFINYFLGFRRWFDVMAILFFILANKPSKSIMEINIMAAIFIIFSVTFIFRWGINEKHMKKNCGISTSFESREICWIQVCVLGILGYFCQTIPVISIIFLLPFHKLLFDENGDELEWGNSWVMYLVGAIVMILLLLLGINLELSKYSFIFAMVIILSLMSGVYPQGVNFELCYLYTTKHVELAFRAALCIVAYHLLFWGSLGAVIETIAILF